MNKKDVLIKIRHEEERSRELLLATERERDQRIESARIEAASMHDSLTETFSHRYKQEIDALSTSVPPEEQAILEDVKKTLSLQYEKGQKNMKKAVDSMLADFVRYIDVKAEEDE